MSKGEQVRKKEQNWGKREQLSEEERTDECERENR